MEYAVIFIVIAFLIGTLGFAVPSKSSRKISVLRMEALKIGFKNRYQTAVIKSQSTFIQADFN